jgi:transmembrane protein TMEM260 (protein O-mannosyltransferase)
MSRVSPDGRRPRVVAALVTAVAVTVFWRTAYPTITWWDSSSYSLAAATLGINSPPGSLLLTLIGWPVTRLSVGLSPAHALNLFAGLLAAVTTMLVYVAALSTLRLAGVDARANWGSALGVAAGALTFGFSGTLWTYATQFTPYVLSAVFTGLILWTMLRWWADADRENGWRWLVLLCLLFGLDFSVHRTNALLIPGALLWIVVRRPTTFRSPKAVLGGAGALAGGLSVQLLVMPIAALTHSTLNFSDPSNLSRFWDYVTIKQLGGSFLLQLFPRKSPIWSVQTMDVLRVLGRDFLDVSGRVGVLGVLPAVAAAWGIVALWRGNRRLAAALTGVLVLQVAFTVLYFNIPANFFRTFDRHYLPIGVTIGVLAACGLGAALERVSARPRPALAGVAALAALVPATQLWNNWSTHDASRRYFARDYAANALLSLPADAIYFTVGDNDTFPVMYLQSVEGMRPDVTIINLSVANVPRWPDQLRERDPSFPLSLSLEERTALVKRAWTDTLAVLRIRGSAEQLGLPAGATVPDSIALRVRPMYGDYMLPSEVVLLDIVRTNAWRRPVAFAITGGDGAMEWLKPYGRIEGLYSRVVPALNPPADPRALRSHMFELARYRGYADSSVTIDAVSRTMGLLSYQLLTVLLSADAAMGSLDACRSDRGALLAHLPFDRLAAPPDYRQPIESACGERPKY